MHKTAVVILNWNGLKFLKMFLSLVMEHSVDGDTVVCVADNDSDDGSADWIKQNHPDVMLIRFDKNHGFARGYNLALAQLDARYFILLNSDIEVTPLWTEPLITYLDKNPDAASCQPKILSYYEKDRFEHAGAAGGYIDRFGYPFCRGRIFHITEKDSGQYDTAAPVFWSTGACMAVRAEAWKKSQGFDDDFFAHMEEIDLCWRFSKLGFKMACIPQSVVYHVGGGALPYSSPFKVYLNFRNGLFLLYKNLPDSKLHKTLLVRRLLDGLAALLFLSKGNFKAFSAVWRAHMDFYRSLDALREKRKKVKSLSLYERTELILNKSIVFEFYFKGNRTYQSLLKEKK
jgi:GT2 family glycosyltransferase